MPFHRLALLLFASIVTLAFDRHKRGTLLAGKLYKRTELGGLCTRSIYFLDDSLFFFEGGCEASSSHYFGRWKRDRDTCSFAADTALVVDPVVKETVKRIPGDSVSVRVRDERGLIIPYFRMAVRTKNGGVRLLPFNESDGLYKCAILKAGESLHLYSLERGYHRPFSLPADSGSYFDITLRIPPNMPIGSRSVLYYAYPFSLLLRGDSLVSFGPEWGGETAVFVREK